MYKLSSLAALVLVSSLSGYSHLSHAGAIADISISVGSWKPDYSGIIGRNGNTASLNELGFSDNNITTFDFTIKHVVPVLPNITYRSTDLSTTATGTLTRTLTINDVNFSASDTVTSSLDLSHDDFTFFYSPLNNWAKLDLGLTLRHFDGQASARSTLASDSVLFDEWVPMAYAGLGFELPLTGWSINSDINYISYDNSTLSDYRANIAYKTDSTVSLTAELGYRKFSIDGNDLSNLDVDIDLDGIYASVGLAF